MTLPPFLAKFMQDAPPAYAFELSEAGVAWALRHGDIQFREFEPGMIAVSPARDNVLMPEAFTARIRQLVDGANQRAKRRPAAVILPDHSARVQVLDFDSFPTDAEDQVALIKFRVKKSVPFDIDSATVSYHVQPAAQAKKKVEVVAALMSLEIVARYEAPFRAAGLSPGFVTTSALAALNLMPATGLNILTKLSGNILSVLAVDGSRLKLVRTVELESIASEEILAVLHPTLAFLEDEMHSKVDKVLLCGFGHDTVQFAVECEAELNVPVEALQSRRGAPGPFNAGLIGYLESPGGGVV